MTRMPPLKHRISWETKQIEDFDALLAREWLITNGLGGYASGTLLGVPTRRYHGLLIAALPSPLGRFVMLNHLTESVCLSGGSAISLGGQEQQEASFDLSQSSYRSEFWTEWGIPSWRYEVDGFLIEKKLLLRNLQNTIQITYRLLGGNGKLELRLYPFCQFRPHEFPVSTPFQEPYWLIASDHRIEIFSQEPVPPLRLLLNAPSQSFTLQIKKQGVFYRVESNRGYEDRGELWNPGYFSAELSRDHEITFIASTEPWETINALTPQGSLAAEKNRMHFLLQEAHPSLREEFPSDLVLASDQFIVAPAGRIEAKAVARSRGDEPRSVIAGYHWFTDWGRDTMISLEGLTLVTGRHLEARWILRLFAHYIREGLIPNLFPEGSSEGLYHTADATLWFFHALHRYLEYTKDWATLRFIFPKLTEVMDFHFSGTRFGIGVDPQDGLLKQGAPGYALTWMDAKVGDWVVTPRRGKTVEINALWYNALRLYADWLGQERGEEAARFYREKASQVYQSFNERFWYAPGGYLYDLVDGEGGEDSACRPNQIFALSLPYPVLAPERWKLVLEKVQAELLTPVGLRSLAARHPDYKSKYYGDLRARDAAYHQGTVWAWLIGPFVDAWIKVHPEDQKGARRFLKGFIAHLEEACVGSISEIFDAEEPFTPRGCIAQAWSVAEVLRAWVLTSSDAS